MEDNIGEAQRPEPTKYSWRDLALYFINVLKKKEGPVITIKMPFLGCMTAMFLSHFSGNGIAWNLLHFFCSWFYVFYRFAEKAAEIL